MTDSNSAKGRDSFDVETGNTLVHFFNRNVTPYATSTLGPKFDLVPVESQKDLMINHARMYAQQEYDRIMELVSVLQKQADDIRRRLDITDLVHAAVYQFSPVMGNIYWLAWDSERVAVGNVKPFMSWLEQIEAVEPVIDSNPTVEGQLDI